MNSVKIKVTFMASNRYSSMRTWTYIIHIQTSLYSESDMHIVVMTSSNELCQALG